VKSLAKYSMPQIIAMTLAITAVFCAIFLGIYEVFGMIEVAEVKTWPWFAQDLYRYLRLFFLSGIGGFLIAWVRNNLGFFEERARQRAEGLDVEYKLPKYWSTVGRYLSVCIITFGMLPPPWNGIATVLAFFVDLIGTELKRIFKR